MPLPPGSPPPTPKAPKATAAPKAKPKAKAAVPPGGPAAAAAASPLQTKAQAEIDPIITAITAAAQKGAGSADAAIQGLTNSYAQGIAGIDYGAPYSSGEAQQAAVDAALQQAANNQGSTLSAGLADRLKALQGSSGADAVNQAAQGIASQGSDIGGAQVASGSAALDQLIADAAAAQSYGQKMPGVIKSAGLQGIEQAQGQAQQAINQGTLQAESQLPSIEQQLKADQLQAQSTKAETAYRNAELGLSSQRNSISAARANASIAQGNARLQQGAARIQIEAQRAAQSALSSNRSYSLSLSRLGIEDKRLQLEAVTAETKYKSGGFTPSELVKLRGTASQVIANGKQKGYTRAQVLNNLIANGIPVNLVGAQLKAGGYAKVPKIPAPKIKYDANGLVANPASGAAPFQGSPGAPPGAVASLVAGARARGLDPNAVLAISSQEGLGGGVGDNGTSFGPFQLHAGGALPSAVWRRGAAYAAQWAWSPQGINYALDRIASVAKGLKGQAAVSAISRRFERPANPGREISGAMSEYGKVG